LELRVVLEVDALRYKLAILDPQEDATVDAAAPADLHGHPLDHLRRQLGPAQPVQRFADPTEHRHLPREELLLELVPLRLELCQQLLDAEHTHAATVPGDAAEPIGEGLGRPLDGSQGVVVVAFGHTPQQRFVIEDVGAQLRSGRLERAHHPRAQVIGDSRGHRAPSAPMPASTSSTTCST
jgi:hypothetical protein